MTQITKEQAAKTLVGYTVPSERLICGNCRFGRRSEDRNAEWFNCVVLKDTFGIVLDVEKEGTCNRFAREPL